MPPTSRYHKVFQTCKAKLSRELIKMTWNPMSRRPSLLTPTRGNVLDLQKQYVKKVVAEQTAFLKRQLVLLVQAKVKQAELLKALVVDLAKEDKGVIAEKLRDPQPLTRWLAIQVVAKKRLGFEADLIPLLADQQPEVRQAAREALVRLSRGTDFGPLLNATAKQVSDAQRRWQQWHDLQLAYDTPHSQAESK